MRLLVPGTGNQRENRRKAVQFVVERLVDARDYDADSGEVQTAEGETLMVSAYAESPAAFVATPGKDKTVNSIYASGQKVVMVRQLKDGRLVIYRVNPSDVPPPPNSSTVQWQDIEKAAERIWVCKDGAVKTYKG